LNAHGRASPMRASTHGFNTFLYALLNLNNPPFLNINHISPAAISLHGHHRQRTQAHVVMRTLSHPKAHAVMRTLLMLRDR